MVDKRKREWKTGGLMIVSAMTLALVTIFSANPALALSELKQAHPVETEQDTAPPPLDEPQIGPDGGLPQPNPIIRTVPQSQNQDMNAEPGMAVETDSVDIITDPALLPEPAQRMRELIIEAAATGNIENLRALLGAGPTATQLAFGEIEADPVQYLRSISGDGEGQEILAILIDLLNTGFVRVDAGESGETFVWPYFTALRLEALTPPQKVELLRLVTAGDVEDMKAYGGYNFYRIGISPEGQWRFFIAGD